MRNTNLSYKSHDKNWYFLTLTLSIEIKSFRTEAADVSKQCTSFAERKSSRNVTPDEKNCGLSAIKRFVTSDLKNINGLEEPLR
jgi:hypothetical protein